MDCRLKLKLDMEEAAARYWRYPDPDTHIYLCGQCGFCHFGHNTHFARRSVVKSKTEYKPRVEVKPKSKTTTPNWMKDKRGWVA